MKYFQFDSEFDSSGGIIENYLLQHQILSAI